MNDRLLPIQSLGADIRSPDGEMPVDDAAAKFAHFGTIRHPMGYNRDWPLYVFSWEATALCHGGLIFEEVNLERYGYSQGRLQPLCSAAHFFGRVPALPYLMVAQPPHGCEYVLGHYRPGSYVPYRWHYPPLSVAGGLAEAGLVTGLFFLIP